MIVEGVIGEKVVAKGGVGGRREIMGRYLKSLPFNFLFFVIPSTPSISLPFFYIISIGLHPPLRLCQYCYGQTSTVSLPHSQSSSLLQTLKPIPFPGLLNPLHYFQHVSNTPFYSPLHHIPYPPLHKHISPLLIHFFTTVSPTFLHIFLPPSHFLF